MPKLATPYRPRRPADTVLHRVVRTHLETFIAHAAETYDRPLPKYVRSELRAYLRCGIFDYGFTRARCEACGHDLLIAFSCKGRGACPSCAGRRMANTAAHVVDRVLPSVPVRQWVLSLPFELRASAAFDAKILGAVVRAFAGALSRRYRLWAKSIGIPKSEFAAITFVQRFGSSLNLNVHLHVVVVDGVFSRDAESRLLFTPASLPSRAEMASAVLFTQQRLRLQSLDVELPRAMAACAQLALTRGDVRAVTTTGGDAGDDPQSPIGDGNALESNGFNLDASVRIEADDDFGREHLLRYCARPPLSLARLTEVPHNQLAYRIKQLRGGRSKVRIMSPLELLARLAALVPPPRHPLVRYHGAVAPRSSWRRDVVPKPRESESSPPREHSRKPASPEPPPSKPRTPKKRNFAAALIPKTGLLTPNVLSIAHWQRLDAGTLLARSSRVAWPDLMRRSFATDVLACPRCTGHLQIIAVIDSESTARTILTELHHALTPRPTRARDPTLLLAESPSAEVC